MNDSFSQSSVVFKESLFLITAKQRKPPKEIWSLVKNVLPYTVTTVKKGVYMWLLCENNV
jgi:hypothetical protein